MTKQKFPSQGAIQFGWDIMKKNFGFFMVIIMIAALPSMVNSLAENKIISIFIWLANIIISMGLIKIALNFYDNKKSQVSDLFSCYLLFFKYLIGSIIYGLIVFAGLILFIIPGIIILP